VICVAGLDERFLNEPPSRVKIPNIRKLMREGAVASGVVGVAPSDSAPSQISLITGVTPAEHGITGYRESASALKALTLWQSAARGGLKTAAVYWPVTTGADIAFDFPQSSETQKAHDIQFESVARKSSPGGVTDSIEKTFPGFEKELWDDSSSVRAATWLLKTNKVDLLLLQLTEIDSEQRETGALSIYARETLENDDELIGQLLASVPPGTIVALLSDHGFENENYLVRPRVLLRQGKQSAPETRVEVEDGLIGTGDPNVANRLRRLMSDGHRHGIAREVPMDEVKSKAPALGKWIAAFDTPQNYVASADDRGPALGAGSHMGVSGLWPGRPGYRSVFVIAGAGIRAGKLGEIDLLQIAPTLADVIGVKLPLAHKSSLWSSISR
jgi:predicted AlkP superfamily pyrophosphatase or phosphodiesterase